MSRAAVVVNSTKLDDQEAFRESVRRATCDWFRGGLPLLPDARPDDGMLDAVVLIAGGPARWLPPESA